MILPHNTAVSAKKSLAANNKKVIDGVFCGENVCVMQHDICQNSIPDDFYKADAIYSELSWADGYSKFTSGSIADGTTFEDYIKNVRAVCVSLGAPSFLVCGKKMLSRLSPKRFFPISFAYHNNYPAFVAVFNYDDDIPEIKNERQLQDFLCSKYNNILDFCCGYGELAVYAEKHNKHCVLSDINVNCIEYIINRWCKND